jgi:hypothetical protein
MNGSYDTWGFIAKEKNPVHVTQALMDIGRGRHCCVRMRQTLKGSGMCGCINKLRSEGIKSPKAVSKSFSFLARWQFNGRWTHDETLN